MATTARTLEGIRSNMRRGLSSLRANAEAVETIVLVNLGEPTAKHVASLERSAAQFGVVKVWSFPRRWVRDQLRRDGEWRETLLGLPGAPIGVASEPPELSATPRAHVPLVGREVDLARLREAQGDIVLHGPPGCGKTRLLAELEAAVFVERDVRVDVVLDDLRAIAPSTVIIDDAGARRTLVRQIHTARRQEPDLLRFQLIAVCWPDEAETLHDDLPGASAHELDLLEVGEIDALLRSVGVSGITARAEILKQAAGRPGWALALVETLRAPRRGADLLSGHALVTEVSRYLRVRGIQDAADVLALIGALGGISHAEQAAVAEELGLRRNELRRALLTAAQSGIVDVSHQWTRAGTQRSYFVRPRTLAAAMVAAHLVETNFPPVDLRDLFDRWEVHRPDVASMVTDVSGLGVASARPLAEELVDKVLEVEGPRTSTGLELAMKFGHLDRRAAAHILEAVRPEFDQLRGEDGDTSNVTSPFTQIAAALSGWQLPEAVDMLLDALLPHPRLESDLPNGPLQGLADTLTRIHPEADADPTMPAFFATTADHWLERDPDDARRWIIWAHVCASALHPTRQGSYTGPGSPMTVTMFGRGLDETEVRVVFEQVWPIVRRRLLDAPANAVTAILGAIANWLWSAEGRVSIAPAPTPHMAQLIIEAGSSMLTEAVPAAEQQPGLAVRLNSIAREHDLDVRATVRGELGDLLSQLTRNDTRSERWDLSSAAVRSAVAGWGHRSRHDVIATLVELRTQLNIAGVSWPPGARIACDAIAPHVEEPGDWFELALRRGLMPEGLAFASEAIRRGDLAARLIEEGMDEDRARWGLISLVLDADAPIPELAEVVVRRLKASDEPALKHLVADRPEAEVIARVLRHDDPAVASAMAVALTSNPLIEEQDWAPPPDQLDAWSQAAAHVADELPDLAHNRAQRFYRILARRCPAVMVTSAARLACDDDGRPQMPFEMREGLAALPADAKIELLLLVPSGSGRHWIVRGIVGRDTNWVTDALERDAITPDEVIDGIDGFDEVPPLEDLAPLLIPRGASAARLAQTAMFGIGWGEESTVNQAHADRFAVMAESPDPSIAAVGREGVAIFSRVAADARHRERQARIRGYR